MSKFISDKDCLWLAGIVLELRNLGDLEAEIVVYPWGGYDILSDRPLDYMISEAYCYHVTGDFYSNDLAFLDDRYTTKVIMGRPILDRVASRLHKMPLPGEGEIRVLPILGLLS